MVISGIVSLSNTIKEAWKNKSIRRRILFTIGVLIIYRIGCSVTIPGVSLESLNGGSNNGIIQTLGILGGGGLKRFTIFALGVSPYITASIIIQLLSTNVIPYLTNLAKSGEKGRKTQDLITRYLTIIFAVFQSLAITTLLIRENVISTSTSTLFYLYIIGIQLGGTFLSLWMGDIINERGLGNGVSMIILSGVVANIPWNFYSIIQSLFIHTTAISTLTSTIELALIFILYFMLIYFVVIISLAFRKVPIQNIGSGLTKGQFKDSYVALKINSSGVVPVIFATAILSIPVTITSFISAGNASNVINEVFNSQEPIGLALYFLLVIGFAYFYSRVTINPEQFAESLQKSGAYIPGISPGKPTSEYISTVVRRLDFFGSFSLAIIAATPYFLSIVFHLPSSFGIGGTGVIIFVTIIVDLYLQLKAKLIQIKFNDKKQTNPSLIIAQRRGVI